VELASRLSPAAGTIVLWFLLGLYAAFIIATVLFFLRLPKPLELPESETEPKFSLYLEALRKRLAVNPRFKGYDLSGRAYYPWRPESNPTPPQQVVMIKFP
jgi:hypothetical protein